MKVLIGDSISEEGIAILRQHAEVDIKTGLKEDELVGIIGDYDAIMVRSQTRVTDKVIQAGKKLPELTPLMLMKPPATVSWSLTPPPATPSQRQSIPSASCWHSPAISPRLTPS